MWNLLVQIKCKYEDAKSLLQRLGNKLVKSNRSLKNWVDEQKKLNQGLVCKLLDTKFIENNPNCYRNKCEFTIGMLWKLNLYICRISV